SSTSAKGKFVASVAVRGELSEKKDERNTTFENNVILALPGYELGIRIRKRRTVQNSNNIKRLNKMNG
ncbi:MAG: hypothetical protein Q8N83_05680, partial [Ignavibacteria bacterium]|nr:hypothetical protein [Ignavibacteria bacterium]